MNVDSRMPRMLVTSVAPLVTLAAALPHSYAPINVNSVSATSIGEASDRLHLVPIDSPPGKNNTGTIVEGKEQTPSAEDLAQCGGDENFTFFAERPLPGTEEEPILIEECDPARPDQIRLAYVANKSIYSKTSPTTSILIGCTTIPTNAFVARQGGGFRRVSTGNLTNFVRRETPMKTLIKRTGRKHNAAKVMAKRSEEVNESKLIKRWESRSDIDQYSDGFHSCRSSSSRSSQACKITIKKEVCLDLEKVLQADISNTVLMEKDSKRVLCDSQSGQCVETTSRSITRPSHHHHIGEASTFIKRDDIAGKGDQGDTIVKREELIKRSPIVSGEVKEKEHAEFMRRWLQGDENPRSFLLRSEKQGDGDVIQKRAVGMTQGGDGDALMEERSWHNSYEGCSDVSDRWNPACKGRMAWLQNYRDVNYVKRSNDDEDALEKRSWHGNRDWRGNCGSDSSCGGRRRWRREVEGEAEVDLVQRDVDDDDQLEKRSHHGRRRRGGSRGSRDRRDVMDDDAFTVRSALSQHGDMYDANLLGKREQASNPPSDGPSLAKRHVSQVDAAEPVQKRDLATAVWNQLVAPLLRRRSAAGAETSATMIKRDLA